MKRVILLLMVFCVWAFMITAIHIAIIRSGRTITRLQQEVSVKEARNQYLELEIARLSSPETVTRFATENLGMVPAKPYEVILLDKNK